jgi:excisionase family DNA binding protein
MPDKAKPAVPEPEFVSVSEASRLLSLGKTKTFELIADGDIETIKVGRKRLIRLRSIRNLGRAA